MNIDVILDGDLILDLDLELICSDLWICNLD